MKDNLLYIDNTPNKQYTPSYTLVSLLNQASPLFKENFTKLITQVINNDQIFQCASSNFNFNWLSNNQPHNNEITDLHYEYTFRKFNKEDYEHIKLNKEWNEEFFTFLDIQFANDNIQNITKEKLLYEFYSLFKQYAIEGVKLIKTKQLSPFSFFESPKTNDYYYMYNNIIFTILDDSYLTNRTYSQDELKQTYLGSNLDLKHVNYLNKNDARSSGERIPVCRFSESVVTKSETFCDRDIFKALKILSFSEIVWMGEMQAFTQVLSQ